MMTEDKKLKLIEKPAQSAPAWDKPDPRIADVLQQRAQTLSENLARRVRDLSAEDKKRWPKQFPVIVGRYVDMLAGFAVVLASEVSGGMDDEAFERAFLDLVKLKFTALRDAKRSARG